MTASRHDDVTVVIANYEYGATLEAAVQSALDQDGGPPRVVIVDDGSQDPHTIEVVRALEERVPVIRQENAGLAAARNTGMSTAETTYLLALDADDLLPKDALDVMRAPLDADPTLGFAYGRMRYFGDWEGEIRMPGYDPYRLLYRHTIGATALMRRDVFVATGGYDPEFRGYEDWEFWLHALEKGWTGRQVDAVTLDYRRHGQTLVTTSRADYHRWYRTLRRKHAGLYARRRDLARASELTPLQRIVHRAYWGPRPIPAKVEQWLYARIFRSGD